jgi:hypothetical protein
VYAGDEEDDDGDDLDLEDVAEHYGDFFGIAGASISI